MRTMVAGTKAAGDTGQWFESHQARIDFLLSGVTGEATEVEETGTTDTTMNTTQTAAATIIIK